MNYTNLYMGMMLAIVFIRGIMDIIYPHPIPRTKPRRGKIMGPRIVRTFGIVEVLISITCAVLYLWRHYYLQ